MWREESPVRLNLILSLVAIMMSLAVGVVIPAMNSSSGRLQTQTGRSQPSPTTTITPIGALTVPLAPLAGVAVEDASDGALIAWQEPGPATPSSIPLASAATAAVVLPTADGPAPAGMGTAPSPTASPSPTPSTTVTPPATASPSPTPSTVATPTATATLSASASPSPTPIAVVTRTATAALLASASPSPTPSSTATLKPVPVPPTRSPATGVVLASPTVAAPGSRRPFVSPPALLQPALNARLRGTAQFEWSPTGALPRGAFYEVVVWSPEQDPNQAWGVAPPRITQSLKLNLDELFRSGRFREGSLYWTVLVVEQDPYQRLTQPAESERRYLVLATDG